MNTTKFTSKCTVLITIIAVSIQLLSLWGLFITLISPHIAQATPPTECLCNKGIKILELQTTLPYIEGSVTIEARPFNIASISAIESPSEKDGNTKTSEAL